MKGLKIDLGRQLNDLKAKVGFTLACAILAKKLPKSFWKILSSEDLEAIIDAGIGDYNLCDYLGDVLEERGRAQEKNEGNEFQAFRDSLDYDKLSLTAILRLFRKYPRRYNEKLVARLFGILKKGATHQQILIVVKYVCSESGLFGGTLTSSDVEKICKIALARFRKLEDLYLIYSKVTEFNFRAWQKIVKLCGDKYARWMRMLKLMDKFNKRRTTVLENLLRCANTWEQLVEVHGLVNCDMRQDVVAKMRKFNK